MLPFNTVICDSRARTIYKKITCEICKKSLIAKKKEQPVSLLQRKKSYGNLISASKDVIRICKIAEKTVRHYKCNLNYSKYFTTNE